MDNLLSTLIKEKPIPPEPISVDYRSISIILYIHFNTG
jgi:hypothetical protein